jgi:hypothetical protein
VRGASEVSPCEGGTDCCSGKPEDGPGLAAVWGFPLIPAASQRVTIQPVNRNNQGAVMTKPEALKLAKLCIWLAGGVLLMIAVADYLALRLN